MDARQRARLAVRARRSHAARGRDRRQARGDHDPQGRGALGHPLCRPPAGPARGQGRPGATDPDPLRARDLAGRHQSRGDRQRVPAYPGHELRAGRSRRFPAHEDHARGRRAPRLPHDRRPRPRAPGCASAELPAGPLALLDRAHGRRLHVCRRAALLRPLRRHLRRRGMRNAVPRLVPARLRGRVVAASQPDRDRQARLLTRPRGGGVRQEGDRGDPRRARRAHDRRQDAGRRHLEAVQGDGQPRGNARQARTPSWRRPTGSRPPPPCRLPRRHAILRVRGARDRQARRHPRHRLRLHDRPRAGAHDRRADRRADRDQVSGADRRAHEGGWRQVRGHARGCRDPRARDPRPGDQRPHAPWRAGRPEAEVEQEYYAGVVWDGIAQAAGDDLLARRRHRHRAGRRGAARQGRPAALLQHPPVQRVPGQGGDRLHRRDRARR